MNPTAYKNFKTFRGKDSGSATQTHTFIAVLVRLNRKDMRELDEYLAYLGKGRGDGSGRAMSMNWLVRKLVQRELLERSLEK